MKSLQEDLYAGALSLWDMAVSDVDADHGPMGSTYRFENEYGTGSYWVHFQGNMFAVNDYDMRLSRDGVMRYRHTEHMSIAYYEEAELFEQSGSRISPGIVDCYVAEEGAEYLAHFRVGSHVRATSITISPDYYRDYLQERFGEVPDVRASFALISGRRDVPDLVALLKRVRDYRGEGIAAQMFYEGAVAEAVGLVMEKAAALRAAERAQAGHAVSDDDRVAVEGVDAYMRAHLNGDLSTGELARIACMGQTKFKQVFHDVFGMAPRDYVTMLRMDWAEQLLLSTNEPIAQIAMEVGYRKPGAFTKAFRRCRGFAPSALRG